jgi:methyl-accepting chemotaxis protein
MNAPQPLAFEPPELAILEAPSPGMPPEAILEIHFRLDQAIDDSLNAVVGDTESSAHAIIAQVRQLHDTAGRLATYLDGTSLKAGSLGREINASVAFLSDIGTFIRMLPAKMERDLHSVRTVVTQIRELDVLVEDVQAIGRQSHMLSINAAIEASRAGIAGAPFGVVAEEMRKLASNSRAVATKIQQGLSLARGAVENGMAASIAESSQQLSEVSQAEESISKLRDNLGNLNEYNETRFSIVTKHNEQLARDIGEVLGQLHYQDVVRQDIERIQAAIGQRNALLHQLADMAADGHVSFDNVPEQLELILGNYLKEEQKHRYSQHDAPGTGGELKIEPF